MFLRPPHRLWTGLSFCALLAVGMVLAGTGNGRSATSGMSSDRQAEGPARDGQTPTVFGLDDFSAMVEIAKGYGEAELTRTETGDPVIVGTIDGTAYQLFFLECTDHRRCAALNFYAIWSSGGIALDVINRWNRAQPFHKAYLTEDGLPTIELNLSTAGGLSGERLADAYDRWTIALAEFERDVLDGAF